MCSCLELHVFVRWTLTLKPSRAQEKQRALRDGSGAVIEIPLVSRELPISN